MEVLAAFESELKQRGLLFGREAKGKNPRGSIVLTECASVGFCSIGPAVMVYPDGVWYAQVRASDVAQIIEEHLMNGRVVGRLALLKILKIIRMLPLGTLYDNAGDCDWSRYHRAERSTSSAQTAASGYRWCWTPQ